MKPVRIFRHVTCEGPGYLSDFLSSRDNPTEIICIDAGDTVPDGLDDVAGLVFMGGPMSVNDNLPWIASELELISRAQQDGLPILGHCLGGQLISKALGGHITGNAVTEIGWFDVTHYDSSPSCHWLEGIPESFNAFHLHGETFSLPEGAIILLKSEYCDNRAYVIGNTLALQFHVEVTREMLEEWVDIYRDDIAVPSTSIQSREQILENIAQRITEMQCVAEKLYTHWLNNFN